MAQAATLNGPAPLAAHDPDRIEPKKLLTFLCMIAGMFMAILDIQIVSASLSEIQAGLSASSSEITWVQTSYLIAEVIMIPLSGFLSRAMGTRLLFAGAAAGFTFSSLMCGLSTSITEMIVWRTLQGFLGGGMIPTVMAMSYIMFPKSRQTFIGPMIGLIITLAPTIGPTVGGLVTDAMSWHWLFFINIVPGIIITIAALTLIDVDKPDWPLLKRCDWIGLVSMAGFLGSLEYVLEEGARNDWFNDEAILGFAWLSGISAVVFFWRVLTTSEPIVDIRAFRNRNFGLGCTFSFLVGIGLFGLTYLYPVYLSQIRGYSALMIGKAMFVTGLMMFLTAPLVGRLMRVVDPRVLISIGTLAFAAGTYMMSGLSRDWDFWELFVPQILRGFGMMMAMVPINNMSLGTLPPERLKNAAALYNVTRNLGGAVGLALLTTLLNMRTDLHLARLHESVTWSRPAVVEMLATLTQRFSSFGSDAPEMALKQLNQMVRRESAVMAFADVFLVMTFIFAAIACFTCLMKRPALVAPAPSRETH